MRSCIPLPLLLTFTLFSTLTQARPAQSTLQFQCFGCPVRDGYGRENYIQEMHDEALVCFFSASKAACIYDQETGEVWPDAPPACPLTAEITLCIPEPDAPALVPPNPHAPPNVPAGNAPHTPNDHETNDHKAKPGPGVGAGAGHHQPGAGAGSGGEKGKGVGSIMALMKEKTGGRLTTQQRVGQGRILAERLAVGGRRH